MRQYNRCWVVDMDLSKCFDRLDHDLILQVVRRVSDGSVLGLIRQFLESGDHGAQILGIDQER